MKAVTGGTTHRGTTHSDDLEDLQTKSKYQSKYITSKVFYIFQVIFGAVFKVKKKNPSHEKNIFIF